MSLRFINHLSLRRLWAGFEFLDPGPFVDGELELIVPAPQWADLVVQACRHPMSRLAAPTLSDTTRQQILDFVAAYPDGRQPADRLKGVSPTYHFWMKLTESSVSIGGGIGLRIAETSDMMLYYGHIGYHVYPPARGHHYAERACRLLLPLAARHGINPVWITCNPDNFASRRTCERLGGVLEEIVAIPAGHPLQLRGEREKCRYRVVSE